MIPGFYGKLPLKGDFIQRRFARSFTTSWDSWLQSCMQESRARLGDAWLPQYLTSPLWRFALSPGIISEQAIIGIVMPSVDRVGRNFPIMLGVELAEQANLYQLALEQDRWFEGLEDIALYGLDESFTMEEFERRLENHPLNIEQGLVNSIPKTEARNGWTHSAGVSQKLLSAGYSDYLNKQSIDGQTLWWTDGSESISSSFLVYNGLPPVCDYAAFISGDWANG
jgi:type VI secretion system protein ImpM